jgi:hypothetical protein
VLLAMLARLTTDCHAGKVKEAEWAVFMGKLTTGTNKAKALKFKKSA